MLRYILGAVALGAAVVSIVRNKRSPLDEVEPEEEIYAGGPVGPGGPGAGGGPGGLSPGGPPMPLAPGGPGGQGPFTATPGPATGISIYPVPKRGQFAYYKGPLPGW